MLSAAFVSEFSCVKRIKFTANVHITPNKGGEKNVGFFFYHKPSFSSKGN